MTSNHIYVLLANFKDSHTISPKSLKIARIKIAPSSNKRFNLTTARRLNQKRYCFRPLQVKQMLARQPAAFNESKADKLREEKEKIVDEPLEYMSRAELQLNIMRNIERKVKELPKRNSFRWWWDHSKNWVRVQELLNMNTRKAGSTSSTAQCRFIGADPDGDTFYKE